MNNHLDITIVNTMPFPSGAASVNRILSYSRGLVEIGNKVTVYSTAYGKDILEHEINGIRYKALRNVSKSRIKNTLSLVGALIRLIRILISKRTNVVILVSNNLLLIHPLYLVTKIKRIKFVQEKSEFPFVLNNKSVLGRFFAYVYVNTTYKLFDGLIIMTYKLEDYFKDKVRNNCTTIVVPMTVEPERFSIQVENNIGDYIAYCGDIGGNKDGVQNLITAFSYIAKDFPSLKLLLIGDSKDRSERMKLEDYIKEIGCPNVVFYGVVSRDKIPPLLCNAKILALARPSSLQSTGGFPTKLGEYLSTGNPAIVTKVGDIPLYLENNKHAFMVTPDDNYAFAENIKYIMNNYESALAVAKKGKNLVYETFNYRVQAKRIHGFLLELTKSN
ncbi:glycosyltransferase [uncultured Proteiniphilum sp.]|uniref:glycosyltransferase n=1 Tax=uncultured Proteiniphilum sp. TaxID=497637 RepID=UPI002616E7A9|nr:glycosyltransferase [uncultured Proteiniphilum sp.]